MAAIPSITTLVSGAKNNAEKEDNIFFFAFVACLAVFATASIYFFPHVIDGDAVGYANAVRVYAGDVQPYIPPGIPEHTLDVVTVHRLLMTPLSVGTLYIFSEVFGSIEVGWIVWDTVIFFAIGILFYVLMQRFFNSHKVAFIGGLFFAGNYSMVTSGLGMFVDISAWFFYVLALFLLFNYLQTSRYRYLVYAVLVIAIGGLFKENAFVAYIPIALVLLHEHYRSPLTFLKRAVPLGILIAAPAVFHHVVIYVQYGYTYMYWVHLAQDYYEYSSIIAEYVKNFGSLLTFLAPLSLAGAVLFFHRGDMYGLDAKRKLFLVSVLISSVPAIMWPAIEQRVLFLVVPGLVLLAGICIKKYERYWFAFLPLALLYVLAGFFMDSFILNYVNLPF